MQLLILEALFLVLLKQQHGSVALLTKFLRLLTVRIASSLLCLKLRVLTAVAVLLLSQTRDFGPNEWQNMHMTSSPTRALELCRFKHLAVLVSLQAMQLHEYEASADVSLQCAF